MKKETGVAVGLGIGFGLLFSLFVILNTQKNQSVLQKQTITPTKTIAREDKVVQTPLEVTFPSDRQIVKGKMVTVKGKAAKGSLLIIQTQVKEAVYTMKEKEETFSIDIPLSLGENIIHLSNYTSGDSGKPQEKQLRVYVKE